MKELLKEFFSYFSFLKKFIPLYDEILCLVRDSLADYNNIYNKEWIENLYSKIDIQDVVSRNIIIYFCSETLKNISSNLDYLLSVDKENNNDFIKKQIKEIKKEIREDLKKIMDRIHIIRGLTLSIYLAIAVIFLLCCYIVKLYL